MTRSQMQNDELVRIAAFNLSEAAKRIVTLAGQAPTGPLRKWLLALASRLQAEECRLRQVADGDRERVVHRA